MNSDWFKCIHDVICPSICLLTPARLPIILQHKPRTKFSQQQNIDHTIIMKTTLLFAFTKQTKVLHISRYFSKKFYLRCSSEPTTLYQNIFNSNQFCLFLFPRLCTAPNFQVPESAGSPVAMPRLPNQNFNINLPLFFFFCKTAPHSKFTAQLHTGKTQGTGNVFTSIKVHIMNHPLELASAR